VRRCRGAAVAAEQSQHGQGFTPNSQLPSSTTNDATHPEVNAAEAHATAATARLVAPILDVVAFPVVLPAHR